MGTDNIFFWKIWNGSMKQEGNLFTAFLKKAESFQ